MKKFILPLPLTLPFQTWLHLCFFRLMLPFLVTVQPASQTGGAVNAKHCGEHLLIGAQLFVYTLAVSRTPPFGPFAKCAHLVHGHIKQRYVWHTQASMYFLHMHGHPAYPETICAHMYTCVSTYTVRPMQTFTAATHRHKYSCMCKLVHMWKSTSHISRARYRQTLTHTYMQVQTKHQDTYTHVHIEPFPDDPYIYR